MVSVYFDTSAFGRDSTHSVDCCRRRMPPMAIRCVPRTPLTCDDDVIDGSVGVVDQ
jgi:hypothetical protein